MSDDKVFGFKIPKPQRLQLVDNDGPLDIGPSLETFSDPFRAVNSGDSFVMTIDTSLRLQKKMRGRGPAAAWHVDGTNRMIVIESVQPRLLDIHDPLARAVAGLMRSHSPILVTLKWLEWRKPVIP